MVRRPSQLPEFPYNWPARKCALQRRLRGAAERLEAGEAVPHAGARRGQKLRWLRETAFASASVRLEAVMNLAPSPASRRRTAWPIPFGGSYIAEINQQFAAGECRSRSEPRLFQFGRRPLGQRPVDLKGQRLRTVVNVKRSQYTALDALRGGCVTVRKAAEGPR